jgi:hypothetical protein
VDEVWDRYLRPTRWPEWSPQIRRVDYTFDQLRSDSAGVVHGPIGVRVGFTVLRVDQAERRWAWRAGLGPIRLTLEHRVFGTVDGATTELVIIGPALVVLGYLPLAQLALQRLVRP